MKKPLSHTATQNQISKGVSIKPRPPCEALYTSPPTPAGGKDTDLARQKLSIVAGTEAPRPLHKVSLLHLCRSALGVAAWGGVIIRVIVQQFACVDGYRPELSCGGDDGLVRLDDWLLGPGDGLAPLSLSVRAVRAVHGVACFASSA